jgi:peptidoglycan/xylan/chitin deacetylase (PgdA/CDA1 family)
LDRTKQELKKLTGYQITFFRPPYEAIWGKKSQIVAKGYKIVDWDVDTEDWKNGRTAAGIYQTVVKQVEPGSIILEHCAGGNRQPTVDSLRWIIHYLKDQGYQIVTVDQLLQIPAYENTHPTKRHSS